MEVYRKAAQRATAEHEARRVQALTFDEYANAWLATRKVKGRPLADRTLDHYQDLLDRFILPTFKDVQLAAITPDMIDHWYELTAVGRPTYQAHSYALLRTILGTVPADVADPANRQRVEDELRAAGIDSPPSSGSTP